MNAFKSHFMNSVFQQPGVYSCAVDCFLEISRYVFFPFLSRLSIRSKFPELIFNALSDYCHLGVNNKMLPKIREPVWLHLAQHCSSFQARDCNAAFSQIFEEKTFGTLTADEISLFATQRMFESYCEKCQKNVFLNSRIFLTFVTELGLQKFGYDNNSWPLYVSNIHTQPGKLHCEGCGSLTSEPFNTSVVNSKFLFIEFSPEIRDNVDMHDKIAVGNSLYTLKALVRCYGAHFTCAVYMNGGKWMYFDDLRSTVREYANLELLRKHNPRGWFFAVFELDENGRIGEGGKIPQRSKIDRSDVREQNMADAFIQNGKKCKAQFVKTECEKASAHFHKTSSACASKRKNPVVKQQHGGKGKKTELRTRKKHSFDNTCKPQLSNNANNVCTEEDVESSSKRATKMKPVYSSVQFSVMGAKTCHFMNSVFQQPGVYSCAVDCFLEISRYVFFPSLSRLTIRSKFPELLFYALSDYCNLGVNNKMLPKIREPVWLHLAQHCSSFQARDCNAAFSQIFEEKTSGTLNADS